MLLLLLACHGPEPAGSGADSTSVLDDSAPDSGPVDSGRDTAPDTAVDTAPDTAVDSGDTGPDSGDTGPDTGDTGEPDPAWVADFLLVDENPGSPTYGLALSPRDYLEQVSGWYFVHAT